MDAPTLSTDAARAASIAWICYSIPALYLATAGLGHALGRRRSAQAWTIGSLAAGLGFMAALALAFGRSGTAPIADPLATVLGSALTGGRFLSVRTDVLTGVMLSLVTFVGWVVVRFSRRYLDGDPEQQNYLRRLQLTLAAVSALVSANSLLVIALLWLGTSLSLHGLLTHFQGRVPAQIAAHKKFLLSRLADVCLLAAVALLASNLHTLELDRIFDALHSLPSLPTPVATAAFLVAVSTLLKCAQLPFHGWLIQVMEAPTPVSALLHAGIVNIGGFLMIRLAPLMARAQMAQNLLLAVGLATAALAALVMLTRISIKVMLAWSTCAQMGLMLVECALGAYEVALLHLVAHSLYKAHAFLSAGSAVTNYRVAAMSPSLQRPEFGAALLAGVAAASAVTAALTLSGVSVVNEPKLWFPVVLLSLALPELRLMLPPQRSARLLGAALLSGSGVVLAYVLGHALFATLFPDLSAASAAHPARAAIAVGVAVLLFVVHAWVRHRPDSASAAWLYPRAFGGFYLDEVFTRLTFRIWPAKLATPVEPALALAQPTESPSR